MTGPDELRGPHLLIVSPHLDDGVLGCGQLLAAVPGGTVLTVFAGSPPPGSPPTPWDTASGFGPGDDPVAARRAEDRNALAWLAATPVWLDFLDAQYGQSPAPPEVTDAVEAAVLARAPTTVAIPLGLFHSDHGLVHEAMLPLVRRHSEVTWLSYEEPMYRQLPGLVTDRLDGLRAAGLAVQPAEDVPCGDVARKQRAIEAYRSQLAALSDAHRERYRDAWAAERYWRLSR